MTTISAVAVALHDHSPIEAKELAEVLDATLEDVYSALVSLEALGMAKVEIVYEGKQCLYGQWRAVGKAGGK